MFEVGRKVIWIKTGDIVTIEEANNDNHGEWYIILAPDDYIYAVGADELKAIGD